MASGAPVGGVDYPKTFQQFRDWFADDEACLDYLEQLRWPDGFVCPVCETSDAWRLAGRTWMCAQCGRKTSVTAGTIFHRSRTPMSTWFAAVWFLASQKNGISALALQQQLGFGSYETAWTWLHKLRHAMVRPDERGYLHEAVDVYTAVEEESVLPGVHLVASLLKRWLAGTLQFSVTERHLAYYLDEYAFRFNRRTSAARGLLFYRLLEQAVATGPRPIAELVAKF